MPKAPPVEKRFVSRFSIGDGCWEWIAGKDQDGYGTIKDNGVGVRAHRLSFKLFKEDPGDRCVLHTCDNPSCVRPDHLFLGTQQDNSRDRDRKGRQAKGINNGGCKLTESVVRQIHTAYTSGDSIPKIANRFGASWRTVHLILTRKTWKHLGLPQITMRPAHRPKGVKETRPRIRKC